jgi:toluene monooxygenase system protein E
MERLLATYDYGEALLALNRTAMPAIDQALRTLGSQAATHNDELTLLLTEAQLADSKRRERWTAALTAFLATQPGNAAYLDEVARFWTPLADNATKCYEEGFAAP